jgi:D-sedoheptulose 7-phosphate isomerase
MDKLSEQEFITSYLHESVQVMQVFVEEGAGRHAITTFADVITEALTARKKIMIAGNGGSAADVQHIAGEFLSRFSFDRAPLAPIALTTDSSVLTAVGNDYGYEEVFERQVLGLGVAGDVFLGISTSGKSPSVLRALQAARSKGIVTLGFTGSVANSMAGLYDYLLCAFSAKRAVIQQIHIVAAHLVYGLVEQRIFSHATQAACQ